jgi:hypothetical protein
MHFSLQLSAGCKQFRVILMTTSRFEEIHGDVLVAGEWPAELAHPKIPVVLRGFARDWPAIFKWSADYLRKEFGSVYVETATYSDSDIDYLEREGYRSEELRLGDVIGEVVDRGRSLRVYAPLERFPERLRKDLWCPPACENAPWLRSKLFLAPAGSRVHIHHDIPHNLHAQIVGRKRWIVFAREDTPNLYPYSLFSKLPALARIDAEAPDFQRFPKFRNAQPIEFVLEPGDVLVLPSLYWHQTKALEFSISANFWFARGGLALLAWASDRAKRILEVIR